MRLLRTTLRPHPTHPLTPCTPPSRSSRVPTPAPGYSGHYTNKQGKVREGSATFWRTDRYRALAHRDIRLRDAFAAPLPPLHAQFQPLLDASPELAHALQRVTTIAQATLLAPVDPAEGGAWNSGSGGCLGCLGTRGTRRTGRGPKTHESAFLLIDAPTCPLCGVWGMNAAFELSVHTGRADAQVRAGGGTRGDRDVLGLNVYVYAAGASDVAEGYGCGGCGYGGGGCHGPHNAAFVRGCAGAARRALRAMYFG